MKNLLQKIANALVINIQNVSGNGLLKGKMGIIIFFYHYARFSSEPIYSDLADDMLDEILHDIEWSKAPVSKSELGEIGIGIDHLIKNNFVEGDPDNVLHDIDDKVFVTTNIEKTALFSCMFYLLCRIEGKISSKDFSIFVNQILDIFDSVYAKSLNEKSVSLAFINPSLLFLNHLSILKIDKKRVESILKKIVVLLVNVTDLTLYELNDLTTLSKLMNQINLKTEELDILKEKITEIIAGRDSTNIDNQIRYLWQNLLYFCTDKPSILKYNISECLDLKMFDLSMNDLPLVDGLAGIGMGIIKAKQMESSCSFDEKRSWAHFF